MDAKWNKIVATGLTNEDLNKIYHELCELAQLADELENVDLEVTS